MVFLDDWIVGSDNCDDAVGAVCVDEHCSKAKCSKCGRHLCPVCGRHYKVMIFADRSDGCSTQCVKESTGDTRPWQPPGARSVIE